MKKQAGRAGMKDLETRYLERLSDLYPTIAAASTEIINLQAILNLPKGTEHFLTDVHGEYEAFSHVLKNGSGSVRRKIEDVLPMRSAFVQDMEILILLRMAMGSICCRSLHLHCGCMRMTHVNEEHCCTGLITTKEPFF